MFREKVPFYTVREFAEIVGKSTSWVNSKILTRGLPARKGRLLNARRGYLIPKEKAFRWLKRKYPELHTDALAQAVKWGKTGKVKPLGFKEAGEVIGALPPIPMGKPMEMKLIEPKSPHPCPFAGCQVACQTTKCALWGIGGCTGVQALVGIGDLLKVSAAFNEKVTAVFGDINKYDGMMLLKKK